MKSIFIVLICITIGYLIQILLDEGNKNIQKYSWPNSSEYPLGSGFKIRSFFQQDYYSFVYKYLDEGLGVKVLRKKGIKEADLVYHQFQNRSLLREGQMFNQVPGTEYLDNKASYGRILKQSDEKQIVKGYNSQLGNPLQFVIDFGAQNKLLESEKEFLERNNTGVWILKQADGIQGQGIKIVHNVSQLEQAIRNKANGIEDPVYNEKKEYILQKYIEKPLLFDGKKFDMRHFIVIVCSDPLIVLYFDGYTRKTLVDYDLYSDDIKVHLGNGDIQRGVKDYEMLVLENHNYDMQTLKEKMIEKHQFKEEEFDLFLKRGKAALTYGILGAKDQFEKRKGDIQIIGVDFVVDSDFKPYLVEFNNSPFMASVVTLFKQLFPEIINDWLDASLALNEFSREEIIQNTRKDPKFVCQFVKRRECQILYNEANEYNYFQSIDVDSLYP